MSAAATAGPSREGNSDDIRPRPFKLCWTCQLEEPMWRCPSCPRNYHRNCAFEILPLGNYPWPRIRAPDKNNPADIGELLKCSECIVAEPSLQTNPMAHELTGAEVNIIMKRTLSTMIKVNRPFLDMVNMEGMEKDRQKEDFYKSCLEKYMDLTVLKGMVDGNKIKTLDGFMGELKWILHNSISFGGANDDEHHHLTRIKDMIEACRKDFNEAKRCPLVCLAPKSTIQEKKKAFQGVCDPPHLLVWAKLNSWPWWPCKVVEIKGTEVQIFFFGDITAAAVKLADCRLFSQNAPKKKARGDSKAERKHANLMKSALLEVRAHIENLERAFGRVILAPNNTPIPKELTMEAIKIMFPDYKPQEINEA